MDKNIKNLKANEILELVFVYLAEISSLRNYDDIIKTLADMAKALTCADRCTVWIVDEEKQKIWTKFAHGIDLIELPIDSGIVGASILSGKREIIDDVYLDKRFNPEVDKKSGYITKSMMVIPMYDNDENVIGAFQVVNHKGQRDIFDNDDMEYLTLASTYAAESLISAKLASEIEETQKEVVFTMGSIAESRSKETANHVKRVAEYSKVLALSYGMDEDEAELLKQASPMHDIGKVAIPDSILNKPGRFNDNERSIMETHAELGYKMIKNSNRQLLKTASIVAYEHHEKWDGSGYPRGLKGDEIHIYGRITALADVFDALGSDRVYKKAWSDERIFQLIGDEKGKHFEPLLVDLFFENIDELLTIREKFRDSCKLDEIVEDKTDRKIKILGAYGTKAKDFGTTSIYLNEQNVIDAGNLLEPLEEKSAFIENIWLTHSHLDHISDIAYIIDNYFMNFKKPINICGLPKTVEAIKKHFLNDIIWPDFTKVNLINSSEPSVKYTTIETEKEYKLSDNESIKAYKTDHTVESCGYIYTKSDSKILITSDTYLLDTTIQLLNNDLMIKSAVIECSFASNMEKLAKDSKHLTPKLLSEMLKELKRDDLNIYINHLKPMCVNEIKKELEQYCPNLGLKTLKDKEIINF
jgi:HD-GYP domain-containing protein (c-di-GMP phosphodiesterase class II)/ribonuclease BN (tRNA processing enzyme)